MWLVLVHKIVENLFQRKRCKLMGGRVVSRCEVKITSRFQDSSVPRAVEHTEPKALSKFKGFVKPQARNLPKARETENPLLPYNATRSACLLH